jgi:transposase
MNKLQTCIGIDVSMPLLDCYAIPDGKTKKFPNSSSGIKSCLKWIGKYNQIHRIVLEPTGGYEKPILKALLDAQRPVSCVNARYTHHFALASQDRAKTDKLDAQTLAEYGQALSPRLAETISPCLEKLEALVERRKIVQDMLLAEKNRLKKTNDKEVVSSLQLSITFLEKSLLSLTKSIGLLSEEEEIKESIDLLLQTKGIGTLGAASIVAYLPELGRVSRQEIGRLVGVAPMNHESGKRLGSRHIRGGRAHVRRVLYMMTLVAVRHNTALKRFYERLVSKGKPKKIALIASMRKLIVWLNAQMARKIIGTTSFRPL